MPYNTRRKSLSLPSLGIQLPSSSRAHRPSLSKLSTPTEAQQPPAKRVKRSHTSDSPSPVSASRPRSSTTSSNTPKSVSFADRPKSSGRAAYEHTPPPSPGGPDGSYKIDIDGINDDIVTGVIGQLEKTGNRPHLLKELAMVLSSTNDSVSSSANPAALLSSRLSTYLRRPYWTALSPCPLGKELIPVHPRKVFYYLTTTPRQEIPADSTDILPSPLINTIMSGGKGGKRIISPSLSNASMDDDAEGAEERKRDALSPSPEVELFTPELDTATADAEDHFATPPTPAGSSFSGRSSLARDGSSATSTEDSRSLPSHRAASPPLEGDEKEFTQTACSMRLRGMSLDEANVRQTTEVVIVTEVVGDMEIEESEEVKAKRNQEAAAALFGSHSENAQEGGLGVSPSAGLAVLSSPLMKAFPASTVLEVKKEELPDMEMEQSNSILGNRGFGSSWEIREPESIELEELDDLMGEF